MAVAEHGPPEHHVRHETDGDDDVGAERAAHGHGDWVDERAVEEPAIVDLHRLQQAGQGVGGADRPAQRTVPQPDLMTRPDFRRHRRERHAKAVDLDSGKFRLEAFPDAGAGKDARPAKRQVEQADDAPARQRRREMFQFVQPVRRIAAADDRADGCADNDVGLYAPSLELTQDADVAPAARRARAERQADLRSRTAGRRRSRRQTAASVSGLVIGSADDRQHGTLPIPNSLIRPIVPRRFRPGRYLQDAGQSRKIAGSRRRRGESVGAKCNQRLAARRSVASFRDRLNCR